MTFGGHLHGADLAVPRCASGPHDGHQFANTQNPHHALHVVGQYVQRHFGRHFRLDEVYLNIDGRMVYGYIVHSIMTDLLKSRVEQMVEVGRGNDYAHNMRRIAQKAGRRRAPRETVNSGTPCGTKCPMGRRRRMRKPNAFANFSNRVLSMKQM